MNIDENERLHDNAFSCGTCENVRNNPVVLLLTISLQSINWFISLGGFYCMLQIRSICAR